MEDYNKIIESLSIKYISVKNISVLQPFTITDFEVDENAILILKKGKIYFGKDQELLEEGHALFFPGNKFSSFKVGEKDEGPLLNMEEFAFKQNEFFRTENKEELEQKPICEFSIINFDTKVFDTVNFFGTLDIPVFSLNNAKINNIVYEIVKEKEKQDNGSQRVIKIKTEILVIELIRHILTYRLFVEQIATNSNYFKDPRLIKLFKYIKDHISGELTNKRLADIADVSEDYVGQYFKTLTGINPQDYIEYQRMEHAVKLLRTTKMSIRDIGKACGYKDTAYFCRRFKMMYGIPAGKMRKRETLMNI
ncbi:MAG: helix-turn-helix transcriptional regulator [Candidatus Cyclobacteriaceae bacterium M2_1C_046]